MMDNINLRKELIDIYTRNSLFGIESIYKDFKYIYDVLEDELLITEYIGSNSVVYIDECFDGIEKLAFTMDEVNEVILSQNLKKIYDEAFVTSGLSKINLENVKYIGDNAFAYTKLFGSMDLSSCEYLGSGAFTLTYVDGFKFGNFIHISKEAFFLMYNLSELNFNEVYLERYALTESLVKKVSVSGYILMEDRACCSATELESFDAYYLEHLFDECFLNCGKLKYTNFPNLI